MAKLKIKAEKRKTTGRKVKKLREKGILPANIYGKKVKSLSVQVPLEDFLKTFEEVGETGLVTLQVNGETRPVLIHNVQTDPITDVPIHADFLQVNLKEKVTATVPVETAGEVPAEKTGTGIMVQQISEVEVEALPTDLPEKFVVDVSKLAEVDDAILVKDLAVDRDKTKILADPEEIVVKIEPPAKEEEVVPAPEAEVAEEEVAEEAPEEAAAGEEKTKEKEAEGVAAPEEATKEKKKTPEGQQPKQEK